MNIVVSEGSATEYDYSDRAAGNITEIERLISGSPVLSTFDYQDAQYYLTEGNGPWGHRLWSYDKIGNRLTDNQGGAPPFPTSYTYTYPTNSVSGNNPRLELIEPALRGDGGGSTAYAYDAAGNQITVTTTDSEGQVETGSLAYDEASRLAQLSSSEGTATTVLSYDGRSFLRESRLSYAGTATVTLTEPVYSSEGLLHTRRLRKERSRGGDGDNDFPSLEVVHELTHLFYFAGRPIAQLRRREGATDELLYLTTDHLGSPVLASDPAGIQVWQGTFEPWGVPVTLGDRPNDDGDALLQEPEKALGGLTTGGVFLRFPGQWDDETWSEPGLGVGVYYNVHRWYVKRNGRYTRPDPLGLDKRMPNDYSYAWSNPLTGTDPFGEVRYEGFKPDEQAEAEQAVQDLRNRLELRPCCVGSDARAMEWLDYIDDPDFTIVLDRKMKDCGLTPFGTMIGVRKRIKISPNAWDCCPGGAKGLNSLTSTIAHEVGHAAHRSTRHPWDVEKRCFGCNSTEGSN